MPGEGLDCPEEFVFSFGSEEWMKYRMVKKARIERINPKKEKLTHFHGKWKEVSGDRVEVVRGSEDLWRSAFLRFCRCSESSISS